MNRIISFISICINNSMTTVILSSFRCWCDNLISIKKNNKIKRFLIDLTRGNPLICLIFSNRVNSNVSSSSSSWWLLLTWCSTVCLTIFRKDFFRILFFDTVRWGIAVEPIDVVDTWINNIKNQIKIFLFYRLWYCCCRIRYTIMLLFKNLTNWNIINHKLFIYMFFFPLFKCI